MQRKLFILFMVGYIWVIHHRPRLSPRPSPFFGPGLRRVGLVETARNDARASMSSTWASSSSSSSSSSSPHPPSSSSSPPSPSSWDVWLFVSYSDTCINTYVRTYVHVYEGILIFCPFSDVSWRSGCAPKLVGKVVQTSRRRCVQVCLQQQQLCFAVAQSLRGFCTHTARALYSFFPPASLRALHLTPALTHTLTRWRFGVVLNDDDNFYF